MNLKWSRAVAPSSELIDAVMDAYVIWREESAAVDASYRAWKHGPAVAGTLAHDNYVAALDREQLAAEHYERLVEQAGSH